ncbi:hypothetical protein PtrSN002B_008941 [Pyrenophora tritici-repentis]|nr:hypothetical protein PtrSN002B_008941 [Pyrenophora tritici-repentis]KAI1583386.1 hypothetical protein PtrEW13061_008832 [Pyrenophora tritici-repentis]PZD34106.1 hypothetical protein A1F97_09057 [Pyrenophora tritici-repentis]
MALATMNNRHATRRYHLDAMIMEEKLKGYIQNLYGWEDSDDYGFALLVCLYSLNIYVIRAIQYTEPGQKAWKIVAETRRPISGINAALQGFTNDLERQMEDKTNDLS